MKLRFVIIKRQLYVVTLLRVKFHNFIHCYLEMNRKKNSVSVFGHRQLTSSHKQILTTSYIYLLFYDK
jgi:hypothetical protein